MKEYAKYELQLIKKEVMRTNEKYFAHDPDSIYRYLIDVCSMDVLTKEHFIAAALSAKGEIIGHSVISIGDLSSSIVHPREVYQFAIMMNAASIIIAHNHPSGDPEPSEEDIRVTERLRECGEILGIKCVDHIVIGDDAYRSFMMMNL